MTTLAFRTHIEASTTMVQETHTHTHITLRHGFDSLHRPVIAIQEKGKAAALCVTQTFAPHAFFFVRGLAGKRESRQDEKFIAWAPSRSQAAETPRPRTRAFLTSQPSGTGQRRPVVQHKEGGGRDRVRHSKR